MQTVHLFAWAHCTCDLTLCLSCALIAATVATLRLQERRRKVLHPNSESCPGESRDDYLVLKTSLLPREETRVASREISHIITTSKHMSQIMFKLQTTMVQLRTKQGHSHCFMNVQCADCTWLLPAGGGSCREAMHQPGEAAVADLPCGRAAMDRCLGQRLGRHKRSVPSSSPTHSLRFALPRKSLRFWDCGAAR